MHRTLFIALLGLVVAVPLSGCATAVVGGLGVGAMMAADRRTPGTYILDEEIELTARARMHRQSMEGVNVNFTSFNRRLLITGEVRNRESREDVRRLVGNIPNVREVIDETVQAAPSTVGARTNDAYLTTKVKARLFESDKVAANHVKVVTEAGTVFLMGIVSRAEGDVAADVAARVKGVARVVKVFEYQD